MPKAQWRATAVALAAAVLLGAPASDANALALGRVTVQSALGEPLRAEIDIPEINAEELSSLRAAIASPDAFRAAGLEYNPALGAVTITLQRRADGRHFLQLSSSRAVNDPFVDLILETNWSSGRIVRDFTMLFDPPNLRQNAPPVQAQVSPAPAAPAVAAAPSSRAAPQPAAPAARGTPTPRAPATAAASPAGPKAGADGKQVTVQQGDTAGKIAAANKPANVSLDQMLVALLRANPEAFAGGNVNRLKAGAVLDMPSEAEASLVPTDDAKQTLVAQSRDFNEFRRRLAEGLPATAVTPSSRQATGKVQASVEEKKGGAPTPDKLTLSKGALQDKASADKVARDRAAQDAATRVAELNKNIADLNKLGAVTPGAAAGGASAAKPGIAVPVGGASAAKPATPAPAAAPVVAASAAKPVASAPAAAAAPAMAAASTAPLPAAAVVAASAPASAAMAAAPVAASASAPASAASAVATPVPAPAAAVKPAVAASKPKVAPAETTLVEDLMENPIVPASIFGILVALIGFAFYRSQQRKKSTQVDSSFLESRLQPDSFFGASGGQRIDTNEGGGSQTGSSMVYSPSQLDAAGDVDPVAEADVYLAYGRDLQAEEILKEAMRTTPQRVAVHAKLLEIYAKRRDAKAFELVATEAYGLTRGSGPEWEHICELGHELDSSNPLYRPGGQPTEGTVAAAAASTAAGNFGSTTATPAYQPPSEAAAGPDSNIDLDLDLDFSIGDDAPSAPAASAPSASAIANQSTQKMMAPPVAEPPEPAPVLDMDFGSATVALEAPTPQPARLDVPDLTLNENSLNFDMTPPPKAAAPAPVAAAPAPTADPGMIEFDLGSLSLDLPGATAPKAGATASSEPDTESPSTSGGIEDGSGDPLATKLALAQEFNAIGDPDGARSLAQEVIAEASGDLKSKAQRFLAEIG